jgi:SAM-dependent methyltransferase
MQTNYRYLLEHAAAIHRQNPKARILDFGCGAGQLVSSGRARGIDMYGADVFYGGNTTKQAVAEAGFLGTAVREIRDGKLDFEDEFFDLVISNQVFEHVEELDPVLSEISRVLKRGGCLVALFPSLEVLREGHIGIPLAHRFRKDSRFRYLWVLALRTLGLGFYKEQAPSRSEWARRKLEWIDAYTHYRSRAEIRSSFERYFALETFERDHILYRLADHPALSRLAPLVRWPVSSSVACEMFNRLGGLVIRARRMPA